MLNAAALFLALATAAAPTSSTQPSTAQKLRAVIALGDELPSRQELGAGAKGLTSKTPAPDELMPSLAAPPSTRAPGSESGGLVLWGAAVLIGAVAFVLLRLRGGSALRRNRLVHVDEVAQVGKGRQLVVVRVDGQRLLLGVSEAGISVLREGLSELAPAPSTEVTAPSAPPSAAAFRQLLRRFSPSSAPAAFESHLTQASATTCSEDEELRQRLAMRLNETSLT